MRGTHIEKLTDLLYCSIQFFKQDIVYNY